MYEMGLLNRAIARSHWMVYEVLKIHFVLIFVSVFLGLYRLIKNQKKVFENFIYFKSLKIQLKITSFF